MNNSNSRRICFVLIVMCLMCITIPAHAWESYPPYPPLDGEKFYFWRVVTNTPFSAPATDYSLIYVGEKAQRDGEIDGFTYSYSRSVTHAGNFSMSIYDFEVAYGISVGTERSLSISKSSAPLKKGEYIKIYYQEMKKVYPCIQHYIEDTWHVNYAEDGTPTYSNTERVAKTVIGYIYEPILPRVKIEYYSPTGNINRTVVVESEY